MNVTKITKSDKKRARYITALMILHGIKQEDIAETAGVSRSLVSMVATNSRGTKKKPVRGAKILLIRSTIAKALNMNVEELWPDKAA